MEKKSRFSTYKIVFVGIMAAVVYVVTIFRFPLFGLRIDRLLYAVCCSDRSTAVLPQGSAPVSMTRLPAATMSFRR